MQSRDFLEELDSYEPQGSIEIASVVEPVAEPQEEPDKLMVFKPMEKRIIEKTLGGSSPDSIALELALPISVVRQILSRSDVKEYLKLLAEDIASAESMRLKALYSKLIDAKVDSVDSLEQATKKDLLDIMKAYQELLLAEQKLQKPNEEQNVFVNILQQVMEK